MEQFTLIYENHQGLQSPCSEMISKTKTEPTISNTDELFSVSLGRLRLLENSGAVIDLSDLLIEINHQLAASLLHCYQYYVGGGAEDD